MKLSLVITLFQALFCAFACAGIIPKGVNVFVQAVCVVCVFALLGAGK